MNLNARNSGSGNGYKFVNLRSSVSVKMYSNLKFRKKGCCEDGIKFEIEKQRERENGVKYEK